MGETEKIGNYLLSEISGHSLNDLFSNDFDHVRLSEIDGINIKRGIRKGQNEINGQSGAFPFYGAAGIKGFSNERYDKRVLMVSRLLSSKNPRIIFEPEPCSFDLNVAGIVCEETQFDILYLKKCLEIVLLERVFKGVSTLMIPIGELLNAQIPLLPVSTQNKFSEAYQRVVNVERLRVYRDYFKKQLSENIDV